MFKKTDSWGHELSFKILIVVVSSLFLASCGDSNKSAVDPTFSTVDFSNGSTREGEARALTVSGSTGTVQSEGVERKTINKSGEIPFNSAMLVIQSNGLSLDESTGYIKNQYWVTSESLNEYSLMELITLQSKISIIAYRDSFGGYLIEYDYDDPVALLQLNLLKDNPQIQLNQRRYTGKKVNLEL